MKRILTTLLLLTLIPFLAQAQEEPEKPLSGKELRKARPDWIGIGGGWGFSSFRDQATSPLFYSGEPVTAAISGVRADATRYTDYGFRATFGNYFAARSGSNASSYFIHYTRLYQIPTNSWERWNLKIGGTAGLSFNDRNNRDLRNSVQGFEMIGSLFATGRVTWDISRKEAKRKKFLFLKFYLPERTRNLAFQLNLGLANGTYRNGFAYLGQSPALNAPVPNDGYELSLFSGFRASSSLDYTIYLKNKNGLQLSYVWDAWTTGGDLPVFEMAHHLFRFTFLFNIK